jgi:NAD(P)-dependent dehydrogenase (short-subunit alcohol dehydrogenase family)
MGKLDGKVALITGGSDGIGLATAQHFVAEGAYVFITGRRKEALDAAVQKIGKKHVTAIQADASKLDQIDHIYQIIKKEKGKFDILFANAALGDMVPLPLITEKHFDDTFNVNVKGVLFTVQKALPIFNDGGSIIINGSVASFKGLPASSVYSATKAAIRSFARTWTVDLKDRKIRVNVLSPGPVETAMFRHSMGGENGKNLDAAVQQISASSPMGRVGQPDEIAKVAVFLASNDSSYITGIELCADGGFGQI